MSVRNEAQKKGQQPCLISYNKEGSILKYKEASKCGFSFLSLFAGAGGLDLGFVPD